MHKKQHEKMSYYSTLFSRYKIDDAVLETRTQKRAIGSVLEQLDRKKVKPNEKIEKSKLKKLRRAFNNTKWFKNVAASLTFATALALFQAPPLQASTTLIIKKELTSYNSSIIDEDSSIKLDKNIADESVTSNTLDTTSLHFISNKSLSNEYTPLKENTVILDDDSDVIYTPNNISNHLTVIDTTIEDWEILAKSVFQGSILLLKKDDNALDKILETLRELKSVDSLNIISHGSSGQLHFSDKTISKKSLNLNKEKWEELGKYLDKEGDINLFGCNVAEGESGKEFIETLAKFTDADVAASINPTGNNEKGGDWELEFVLGKIEESLPVLHNNWKGLLAKYYFTNDYDSRTAGSYSQIGQDIGGSPMFEIKADFNFQSWTYYGIYSDTDWDTNQRTIYLRANTQNSAISTFDVSDVAVHQLGNSLANGTWNTFKIYAYNTSGTQIGSIDVSGSIITTNDNQIDKVTTAGGNFSSFNDVSKLKFVVQHSTTLSSNQLRYIYLDDIKAVPTSDLDATLTASATVTEPVSLPTTADTTGEAVNLFDFTITDGGGGDGLSTDVSQIVLNTSGTGDFSKVTWRLNGPGASNVTGAYNSSANTITFSGLNISVADGGNETYTINGYFSDNTGVVEDQTFILSVDGDTDLTLDSSKTQMASTSAVTNGSGTTIDVTATALSFTTQPAGSVSGNNLTTQPVVKAVDAAGNVDTDFSETVTLTEASVGTLTGSSVSASSGVATFTAVNYTATADGQSFTLTANDQNGVGSDLPTVDANAVTSDVEATKLVFTTQPSPTALQNGVQTDFTTDPVVEARDANDILDTDYSYAVEISENGTGTGTFTNNSTSASAGVATFTGLTFTHGEDEVFQLVATGEDNITGNSSDITVTSNQAPTIGGIASTTTINDTNTTTPFSSVTISDNENDNVSVTVTLDTKEKGTFTSTSLTQSGFTDNSNGSYTLASTTPTLAQTAIRKLVFDPSENRVAPASTELTTFTITVNDGNSNGSNNTTTVTSTSVNDAPIITSNSGGDSAAINVAENTTAVTTVTNTDADTGDAKTYSISGGADSNKFGINSSTGVLTFSSAPNFENPTDTDLDNTYEVQVQVSDGDAIDTQAINVTVTNDNTEAPSVTLSTSSASVAENGGTSTLTATLSEAVSADTTVTIARKNTSTATLNDDFTLSSTNITIDANSTTGTATLTAVDDLIDDNSESAIIEITAVSGGESATESGTQEQTVTITDDDSAGFTLSQTTASVDENGTTDSFTVVLDTQPTSNVAIDISSGDTSEVTLSTSTLTFTPTDWNSTQTVTLTGVDDNLIDGLVNSTITLAINDANSDDVYDALSNKSITVSTTDDDSAGFTLSKTTASVDENGTTDSFTVVLDSQPNSDVVLNLTSSDIGEVAVSPANLTFTNGDWNSPQTVTLTGVDDTDTDGDIDSNVTVSIDDANSDNNFDNLANKVVTATTIDDDNQLPIITEGTSTTVNMSEDANPTPFSLTLNATDGDNDTLTWSIDTNATKGTASVSGTGNSKAITYTPNINEIGNDSFVVKVTDVKGGSDTITVNVNIENQNDAPTFITNLSDLNISEDVGILNYELNATDIEGDDLNITVESNNTNILTVNPSWNSLLSHGDYNNLALDFNLSTVQDANGKVKITIKAVDENNASSTEEFILNVNPINDAPTSSDLNITIDEDTNKTFTINDFNFTDVDKNESLENIVITSLPNKGSLKVNDTNVTQNQAITSSDITNLVFTPVVDKFGTPYTTFNFKVNDGDANSTNSYTATINVTNVDDAPVIDDMNNTTALEDSNDLNITLPNSSDIDGDNITYSVKSSDESIATVTIVDGKIVVTPVENANGTVTIDVIASANDKNATQSFNVDIQAVNDAPKFKTSLSDITIDEDSGTTSYELNATDIEGDELNITLISNKPNVLSVNPNWNNPLVLADYNNQTLDFNLTTKENKNGKVDITINVIDNNGDSTSSMFTVNVNPVNDKPTLASLSDMIVYKNFDDINYTLVATDVDGDVLDYNVTALNPELVDLSVSNNIVSIKSIEGQSGKTDVNITVSDSEYSVSEIFNLQILSFEDGDSVEEKGEVTQNIDTNGTKTTTITVPDDNLTVQTKEDSDGTVSHEIDLGDKKVVATSDINGTKTELTSTGVTTTFEDTTSNVKAEVNATVTGEAIHTLSKNGKTTKAESKFVGANTKIKDVNGSIEIETAVEVDSNTSVKVVAKEDGSAIHTVKKGSLESKATSKVPGANTVIDESGNVDTQVPSKKQAPSGKKYEAVAHTDNEGKTVTKFRLVDNLTGTEENPEPTLKDGEKFPVGSEVVISEDTNKTKIQTTTPVLDVQTSFEIK